MITNDQIHQIVIKTQTSELNVKREYVQQLFLRYFYQQNNSEKILFKGGTALRLIYHSPRFSEDLDFSCLTDQPQEIEKLIEMTLVQLAREGVGVDLQEAKMTSGGYFSIINFQIGEGSKISIQLQFSFRLGVPKGELSMVVGEYLPPFVVWGLVKSELVAEKLQALQTRQKPRDFYDLYFILRANLLSLEQRKNLRLLLPLLRSTKINFTRELKIFLPVDHWPIIRNLSANLMSEIDRLS